ncbi:MAG: transposase [Candidatus Cloacimonadaceae bacterium]|nr:transposase [Candidatus Cloacimonadaceae bacterium]
MLEKFLRKLFGDKSSQDLKRYHPKKNANWVEVNLVVLRKFKNGKQKGRDFYLLCDFNDNTLTEDQIINKAYTSYRKRWAIEESHRQMKQDLKWKGMRLASYTGLKNLNTLLSLALYFIYSCKGLITKLAEEYPDHYFQK